MRTRSREYCPQSQHCLG